MILNIEKSTGIVRDIGQRFDERYFDNAEFPDDTIPSIDKPQFYYRDVAGKIVRLPAVEVEAKYPGELEKRLRDEWRTAVTQLIADVTALPAGPQKQIISTLIQTMRIMAKMARIE